MRRVAIAAAAVLSAALHGCGTGAAVPAGPELPPVQAPPGVDVAVDGLEVTQGTQTYPAQDVPLVQDRSAWVRVFLRASGPNALTPTVRVRFHDGTTVRELLVAAPAASVPTSVDPLDVGGSWNAAVPASWVRPGMQVEVDIPGLADADAANDRIPPRSLDVRPLAPWRVTLIPVRTGDGLTGAVDTASRDRNGFVDFARRIHPVPDAIDVQVAAVFSSSVASVASGGTGWSTVLSEVDAKRVADGATNRTYYGVLRTAYSGGVAGVGYVGGPAAIGWDRSSAPEVMAHEVGHTFGREHSPCGGPSGVDPSYPTGGDYAGGHIGVPGWDVFDALPGLMAPASFTDIMGYCGSQWVSDYTYRNVLAYRQTRPVVAEVAVGDGLLVWGLVDGGRAELEGAFRVPATASLPEPGPLTWEARDAAGRLLARVPFQAQEVADLPGAERPFAFVVPMTAEALASVQSLHLFSEGGRELARRARRERAAGLASSGASFRTLGPRRGRLEWDARSHPVALLRDARSGEVRGFARGGSAELGELPEELEVHLSDGVKSELALRVAPAR